MFRTPNIRKISLLLYVIWFSVYLAYYGLVLNINNFAGDLYINTVISGTNGCSDERRWIVCARNHKVLTC